MRQILVAVLAMFVGGEAQAGSGPWVPGPGEMQVFLGGDVQRFGHLGVADVDGEIQVLDVDEGISAVDLKAIVTYGILGRFEVEGTLPWYYVYANRTDGAICAVLGPGSCDTTSSIGIVTVRGKGLVLDEISGSPVSLALGAELRNGAFAYANRERVTNVGEGGLDLGGYTSIGRVGGIGADGSWAAYAELGGRYRFANTRSYTDASCVVDTADTDTSNDTDADCPTHVAPGAGEYWGTVDFLLSPTFPVAFGPEVAGLWRPTGLAWYELNLLDEDRFAALKIGLVRAGGKVILRNQRGASFVASVLGTVYAYNNPTDAVLFSVGVGLPMGKRKD